MCSDEKKPPVGGVDDLDYSRVKHALQLAVGAASDFKYWLEIQAPGKAFHPSGCDARDTAAYKSAVQVLAAAQFVLNDLQCT